ncbi:hypothetical protein SB778_33655, partial [Paraburkholderia sp. SIMBA_050]
GKTRQEVNTKSEKLTDPKLNFATASKSKQCRWPSRRLLFFAEKPLRSALFRRATAVRHQVLSSGSSALP